MLTPSYQAQSHWGKGNGRGAGRGDSSVCKGGGKSDRSVGKGNSKGEGKVKEDKSVTLLLPLLPLS